MKMMKMRKSVVAAMMLLGLVVAPVAASVSLADDPPAAAQGGGIEAVRLQSPAGQFIDHHRRVHAARQQHSNPLIFQLGPTPSSIVINHISFRLTKKFACKDTTFSAN